MKEAKSLKGVSAFHNLFDLPVIDEPAIPSKERSLLRINLLEEELKELKEAIEANDLVEVADAFCDIQYVLSGAILEFGMGKKFRKLFKEVQRSNMSKACQDLQEAEDTLNHYRELKDTEGYIKPKEDKYLVYRKSDHKVLKSIKYSPARIAEILKAK
ncbi:MAG TPA: nucleoside triphosphate pyrophosphohydrolase family protein [Saprospiraceae bacterium]|nr:nucleoside triphosphate pyrophosphohydrolase family protein [Saprospiraceae bacterium]